MDRTDRQPLVVRSRRVTRFELLLSLWCFISLC
jgi:hypothetical protein